MVAVEEQALDVERALCTQHLATKYVAFWRPGAETVLVAVGPACSSHSDCVVTQDPDAVTCARCAVRWTAGALDVLLPGPGTVSLRSWLAARADIRAILWSRAMAAR